MWTIAGNIAFLINYTYGPGIESTNVSVPIIDIRVQGQKVGQRATGLVHDRVGKFTILVNAQVNGERYGEVMYQLTEKVDAIIKMLLDREGPEGKILE